jgi:hypothetical protein
MADQKLRVMRLPFAMDSPRRLASAIEALSENLTCLFCLDVVKEPSLLPCCSQIVCGGCLAHWCETHTTCPYCRHESLAGNFIKLNWNCDFRKLVGSLQQMTSESSSCRKHHRPTEFFCQECSLYLCSDCLFDELVNKSHSGHTISRMVDIFNGLKVELLQGLKALLVINQTIQERALAIRDAAVEFDSECIKEATSIARFFEFARRSADQKIKKYRHELLAATELLLLLAGRAENISKTVSSGRDIPMDPAVIREIHQLRMQIDMAVQPIRPPHPQEDFFPPFARAAFIVEDFRSAIAAARDPAAPQFVYTASAQLYGNLWRLKVYPFGNMNARGTHVSIFVEMCSGPNEKTAYLYRVEMESSNPAEAPIIREFRSEFVVNDSWGWNRGILIEKVTDQGFLTAEYAFVVTLYLRPETYFQACRDFKVLLEQEKEKYRALKATINREPE